MANIEALNFGNFQNIKFESNNRTGFSNSAPQDFISAHKEIAAMMKDKPMNMNLAALTVRDSGTFNTAMHEVMHGLVRPGDVVAMKVKPEGPVLGWTLMKTSDDAVSAAGIVHGDGYGSDMAKIQIRALLSGRDPNQAVNSAVNSARGKLDEYRDNFIPLVAKGVTALGALDGSTFRGLMAEAYWELSFKDRWGFFPPNKSELDRFLETEIAQHNSENSLSSILSTLKDDEHHTLVADLDTQETLIIKLVGKNIVDIQVKCSACGMPGGHWSGCPANRTKNDLVDEEFSPSLEAVDFIDKVDKLLQPANNSGQETSQAPESDPTAQLDVGIPDSEPVESEPTFQPEPVTPIFDPDFGFKGEIPVGKKREVVIYQPPRQPDNSGLSRTVFFSNN